MERFHRKIDGIEDDNRTISPVFNINSITFLIESCHYNFDGIWNRILTNKRINNPVNFMEHFHRKMMQDMLTIAL